MRLSTLLLICIIIFAKSSTNISAASEQSCDDIMVANISNAGDATHWQLNLSDETDSYTAFDPLTSDPIWSPNGLYFAITEPNTQGDDDLPVVSRDGNRIQWHTSERGFGFTIVWSPDSRWIAYESTAGIFSANIITGEQRQLIDNSYSYFIDDWSPNGEHIALTFREGGQLSNIIIVDVETGIIQEITSALPSKYDYFVSWTPDSNGILFNTNRFSEELSLHYVDINTLEIEPYIDAFIPHISWDSSMTTFTYVIAPYAFQEIYIRTWETGEDIWLTEGVTIRHENHTRPELSPSRLYVAFVAIPEPHDRYVLSILNTQTGEITQPNVDEYDRISSITWLPCPKD